MNRSQYFAEKKHLESQNDNKQDTDKQHCQLLRKKELYEIKANTYETHSQINDIKDSQNHNNPSFSPQKKALSAFSTKNPPLIQNCTDSSNASNKQKKYAYIRATNNLENVPPNNQQSISYKKQQSIRTYLQRKQLHSQQQQKLSQYLRPINQSRQNETYNELRISGKKQISSQQPSQKDQYISHLREELRRQKQKFEDFQQSTLRNQIQILETINHLQMKLRQLKEQNNMLRNRCEIKPLLSFCKDKEQLLSIEQRVNFHKIDSSNLVLSNSEINRAFVSCSEQLKNKQQQYQSLLEEHKKIKGIGKGLVDMMKKVDNIEPPSIQDPIKFAWKWIKRLVWEHEAIRKKAFHWKKAYDDLNRKSSFDSDSQIGSI